MTFFWHELQKPIIALAPMDGITDASFRYLVASTAMPDILFTEFVNVDSLMKGAWQQLEPLRYDPEFRPIVAQIYGAEPSYFYKVAHLVCEMGFDGIDINMGCPAKKIAARGAGAGLILYPKRAQEIISQTKAGIKDWSEGQNIRDLDFPKKVLKNFENYLSIAKNNTPRKIIPVSVKTRIGFDKIVLQEWTDALLEKEPVAISIHGRTLKQMYQGQANWDEIGSVVEKIKNKNTLVLGNGDLTEFNQIVNLIKKTNVDGVMIGRASIGKPWLFKMNPFIKKAIAENINFSEENFILNNSDIIDMMIKHLDIIQQWDGSDRSLKIFRHVKKYAKQLPFEKEFQTELFQSKSSEEFRGILMRYKTKLSFRV